MIYCPILNIMSAARVQSFTSLATQILRLPAPAIVAIDGRSASGKSTFASRLTRALECQCVHTDDIAWNHSFFDWWPLLIHHVLEPFRAGQAVLWTPDAWREHERSGAIIVQPAPILLVEGVSSTRRELSNWIDYTVWMETDVQLAETRGLERDGPDGRDFWFEWQRIEQPFFAKDQPWTRAALIVDGAPTVAHDADTQFVTGEVSATSFH